MNAAPIVAPMLPRIIGHRGACGYAPENTLASLRKAAQLGARWVEFDVRLTAEGRCVLLHDSTLDRTTDGEGTLADFTLDALAALDSGSWFAPEFAGETIPTLEEAIDLLGELGLGANVEIKADPGDERAVAQSVADILQAAWPGHLPPPLVSSFDMPVLAAVAEAAPEIALGMLCDTIAPDWLDQAQRVSAVTIHCDHVTISHDRVAEIRAAGYPLLCYTVNRPERARELIQWGVTGVFTDVPDRILTGTRC